MTLIYTCLEILVALDVMFASQGFTRQSFNDDGQVVVYWENSRGLRGAAATFRLDTLEKVSFKKAIASECVTADGSIAHYHVIDYSQSSRWVLTPSRRWAWGFFIRGFYANVRVYLLALR